MIKSFVKQDNELIVQTENGSSVKTQFAVGLDKVILFSNNLIVMTDTNQKIGSRNIFRISEEGKIIWQVQHPFEFRNIKSDSSAAFTYLGIKDGKIKGGSMDCFTYEIDFETGKLSNPVFTK